MEKTTFDRMDKIESALQQYLRTNGTLPCPANRTLSLNNASLGTPTDCTLPSATGTTDVGASSSAIRIGAIPIAVLNLDRNIIFDGWTNRFTYAVVKNLATTPTAYRTYSATGSGPFTIRDKNTNQINISTDIAYIIISHGEKGNGSYHIEGAQIKACGATLESENCNNDNIFVDAEYYSTPNSSYYDDILRWKTRSRLIKTSKLAIALP